MLHNKTIAVIVPAYNEETQIGFVIESIPEFVNRIIVINDCSKDKTKEQVLKHIEKFSISRLNGNSKYYEKRFKTEKFEDNEVIEIEQPFESRITLINHLKNKGKGGGIITGYKYALENGFDCTATMDGDGQMDPDELEDICNPIVKDNIDYTKGNRLIHRSALLVIPRIRYFGNSILSILTKIASGYWYVSDTQTGYTAISQQGLKSIDIDKIYPSYGYCNDVLVKLNIARCTIKEVQIKPVYEVGENSKMNIRKVIPKLSKLLLISFFKRIWYKYFLLDMHPISLLYFISLLLMIIMLPFSANLFYQFIVLAEEVNLITLFIYISLFILLIQSLMFAMWFDIQDNKKLYKQ